MPEFGGVTAGNEVEEKKRSAENVGASIANAILVAIVSLFAVGSLWLGIFAIPAFFAFFKASVVTISSIREGVNQLQAGIPVVRPLAFRSLKLGAACGLVLTFLAGGLTILFIELLQWGLINDNEDAKNAFTGVFRILGAILFTHLAVSVLQQGTFMVRSASYYQEAIEKMKGKTDTSNGPERSQIFYMGLGASLREGMESYIYMIPLGGAYDSKLIPLPAVLGAIGGLLAARYIAPALIWGGIAAFDVITPDSGAKSWTIRREALTNQYVSRLAAQATGKANVSANGSHYDDDGEETKHSNQIKGDPSNNLSHLSAEAIQNLFKDSNVDPEDFDGMDYAQKRLLLLKSSKALMESDDDDDDGDDHTEDKPEPAVLVMQNLHQRVPSSDANGEHHPGETSVSGQSNMFHRRRPSLMSIAEDEDGYLDRGGYSDSLYSGSEQPGHAYGVSFSGYQGSVPGHRRQRSGGSTHSSGGGSTKSGPSVHFQDDYATGDGDDDDAASVMQGFEHRHLRQAGARNPKVELEVMASTLSQLSASKERRGSSKNFTKLKPGSPKNTAPRIPGRQQQQRDVDSSDDELDIEASIGGNFALGRTSSKSYKSKRSSGKSMPGSSRPRHYRGSSLFSKFAGPAAVTETEENDDEDDNDTVYNGRNAVPEDFSDKSFIATICLAISAFVMFVCCAGLFKMGVLDMKGLFTSSFSTVFDMCGCCEPDEDGSVSEAFFAIFESQFGYTCEETTTGLIAWLAYWLYPFVVVLFTTRAMCFSGIPEKSQPQMAVIPERRTGTAAHAAGLSMKTTKRFLSGDVPDPARIKHHPTSFWIKLSALLNVVAGTAYIWWRAARSMPEDPVSPVWNWLFFAGECILVVGIWTSHLQRSFPSVRDVCTMDDLVDIDSSVADEALVCIMVPTAGEKMKNLKHVLLGAYSQRLWATKGPANRQLRVAVLDEKGRHEVRDLVEKVYHLAQNLVNPVVQQELCSKFDEPFITPKIFMDYYNQMDALDKFVFREECHPAFDMALRMENYSGAKTHGLGRGSSSSGLRKNKGKAKGPAARLEEGFKQLFYTSPNIPSMIYSARANPGTPKVSPKAGNMNAAIFPNSPGEEPVIGDAARVVIVNDARHRLKTDFLQRTVPYFFKLDRRSGKNYNWADVGYVQTPQRFEDLGDGDPLGNHAVLTFFVSNVSKDGVGGVTSCGQGSLWRVDALRGMAADGRQTVDHKKSPETIGHDCGFRAEVLIEDTHTSLEFFKLQWRSAYVCEAGETLAVCVEQPNTVAWRVKQVFRWHIGAVQLLLKDGIGFLCTSKMPTPLHKMFGLDSLTYYIQAVGGIFIILMPIMFSIFQETPFNTVDLEFVYFFFPFIITATFPTILAVGWKNVNPNRVLTDEQFWLSTCYVQVWAFALGVWNRVTCANPDNAWNLVCPVWPLGLIFCLLILSCINTTIYWMYYLEFDKDGIWIFLASFGACLVVMYSIWPMVKLWWPGWVALPSAYHQKFCYILIFIALTSVLATFIDL